MTSAANVPQLYLCVPEYIPLEPEEILVLINAVGTGRETVSNEDMHGARVMLAAWHAAKYRIACGCREDEAVFPLMSPSSRNGCLYLRQANSVKHALRCPLSLGPSGSDRKPLERTEERVRKIAWRLRR